MNSPLKRVALFALAMCAWAGPKPVALVPNPCTPRFAAGSVIHNPAALYSSKGVLNVRFSYQQTTDSVGRSLHCFMTDTGLQEPTRHVNPGDTLNVTVTNNTPPQPFGETFLAPNCGGPVHAAALRDHLNRIFREPSLPRHQCDSAVRRRQRHQDPNQSNYSKILNLGDENLLYFFDW
jgi:hypothetical protein